MKLFFAKKNEAQISGFAVAKKAPRFRKKKTASSVFVQIRPTKRCAEIFFKINGSRDI